MARQVLIPKSLNVPPLYSQEDVVDPVVVCKLFTPMSSWTWLLTEYDPAENMAFGFCYDSTYPDGAELGYVSITELESLKKGGIPAVERDLYFKPKPLSGAKASECPGA